VIKMLYMRRPPTNGCRRSQGACHAA